MKFSWQQNRTNCFSFKLFYDRTLSENLYRWVVAPILHYCQGAFLRSKISIVWEIKMSTSIRDINLEDCEQVAVRVAKQAGQLIKDTCGLVKSIDTKQSFADLVTETDRNVEQFVFDELKKSFPEHNFIGEEGVATDHKGPAILDDGPTWIVDPVDGTMNFVHTFPFVAVCIGLAINKTPVLGVVYCPALEQLYTARKGNGAYCNGSRINVRCSASLEQSLVCAELGSDRSDEKRNCVFRNMESVGWKCHGLRSLGSAAMNICSVATGQSNAFFEFGLHCWDMCAPVAILLEAGGFTCDTQGGPLDLLRRRLIVACNEKIALELSASLCVDLELPSD